MKRKREQKPINAGSMADIAFLLLIFFLVATTMENDQGIMVTLPPISQDSTPPKPAPKSEVLEILVNGSDELLVEGKRMDIGDLSSEVVKHLNNMGSLKGYSSSPTKAIVSLQNHSTTSYKTYIQVYNEIRAGYRIVRDESAMKKYGRVYKNLNDEDRKVIKGLYPLRLSEAELVAKR